MDHKKISMESFDEILKALDIIAKEHRNRSLKISCLDEKVAYRRKVFDITDARRTLISQYSTIEDYAKTGKIEIGKLILPKKCKTCGK